MIIINSYSNNKNRNVSSVGPWVCRYDSRVATITGWTGVERLTAKDQTLKTEVFESVSTRLRTTKCSAISSSTNSFGSKREEIDLCTTATADLNLGGKTPLSPEKKTTLLTTRPP